MAIKIDKKSKELEKEQSDNGIFDILNKDIQLFSKGLNDTRKEQIYTSLHALAKAGIPLAKALETVRDEMDKEGSKKILNDVLEQIIAGSSLSAAFKASNNFSNYEYLSIQIGEDTGKLTQILKELHLYFAQKVEQRRKLIGALSYPFVVISVAIVVVVFMLQVIVPLFADIFKRFGGNLPWITQTVLSISDFVKQYVWYLLLSLFAFVTVVFSQRKNKKLIQTKDVFLLKIPVIKELVLKIYLTRFCRSMALLIASNIPITKALGMLSEMISFYPISKGALVVKGAVLKGKPIHQGFKEAEIFPNKVIALVKIGEEVNKLEDMFIQLAEQYRQETEYQLQIFNSLLEPFLIIFLAVIIGVILVAMYLPIFQLSSQMI